MGGNPISLLVSLAPQHGASRAGLASLWGSKPSAHHG